MPTPDPTPTPTPTMHCRLCGKTAHEIKGYLHRVNEKGVTGIWECRPSCDAALSPDDRLLAAIEGPHDDPPPSYDMSIHSNPDARAWAAFFMKNWVEMCQKGNNPFHPEEDYAKTEEWLVTWFANAMMAAHDHLARAKDEEIVMLKNQIKGESIPAVEIGNLLNVNDTLRAEVARLTKERDSRAPHITPEEANELQDILRTLTSSGVALKSLLRDGRNKRPPSPPNAPRE